jgi:diaminopimelate epimerase
MEGDGMSNTFYFVDSITKNQQQFPEKMKPVLMRRTARGICTDGVDQLQSSESRVHLLDHNLR